MTTSEFSREPPGFLDAISEYLDFLFTEFGFAVVHQEDSWGEHGLVILESSSCQVKVIFDRGAIEISLGKKGAARTWSSEDRGRKTWFYLRGVVDYLQGRPKRTLAELLAEGESHEVSQWSDLAEAAELLRPVAQEAFTLFGEGPSPETWKAFETYYTDNQDLARELQERFGKTPNKGES